MDSGSSVDAPRTPCLPRRHAERHVMFNRGGIGSPKTAFRTMVNAKTGEAIEVPDLDPSRGVYLVFSDPDTAVGCSPERGALAVYEPVG